jgi:hypothetical protein
MRTRVQRIPAHNDGDPLEELPFRQPGRGGIVRAAASPTITFSAHRLEDHQYFHVTSFRGRREQPVRDLVLQRDIALQHQGVRKVFKRMLWRPNTCTK